MAVFFRGDAIQMMKKHILTASVDLVYIDPPFATTQNWWDSKIDWKVWFEEAFRILKPTGNIVIHCSMPFTYELIRQAPHAPNYHWIWNKINCTNPFISKIEPRRCCEEILVWKGKGPKVQYFPQRVGTEKRTFTSKGQSSYYGATSPQKEQTVTGFYQKHIWEGKIERKGYSTRPIELMKLIINSYTKPSDVICDTFCYNGISSTCCPGRRWIGIDLNFFPLHLMKIKPPT